MFKCALLSWVSCVVIHGLQIRGLQAAVEVPPRAAMLAIFRQVLSSQPPQPPPPTQHHHHQSEQEPPAPPLPSAVQPQSYPEVQDLALPSSAIAAAGASSFPSSPLSLSHPPNPWVSAVSSTDPSLTNVEQLLEALALGDRRVVAAAPGVCHPVDGGVGDAAEDGLTSGETHVTSKVLVVATDSYGTGVIGYSALDCRLRNIRAPVSSCHVFLLVMLFVKCLLVGLIVVV